MGSTPTSATGPRRPIPTARSPALLHVEVDGKWVNVDHVADALRRVPAVPDRRGPRCPPAPHARRDALRAGGESVGAPARGSHGLGGILGRRAGDPGRGLRVGLLGALLRPRPDALGLRAPVRRRRRSRFLARRIGGRSAVRRGRHDAHGVAGLPGGDGSGGVPHDPGQEAVGRSSGRTRRRDPCGRGDPDRAQPVARVHDGRRERACRARDEHRRRGQEARSRSGCAKPS